MKRRGPPRGDEGERPDVSNSFVARFVGGSPIAVALRLIVVSLVVGFLLDAFGLEPAALFQDVVRMARRIVENGFSDLRQIGRIMLTGAIVVVPVWIILRLLDAGKTRS